MKKLLTLCAVFAALCMLNLHGADELMFNLKPVSPIMLQNGKFNLAYSRSFVNDKDKVCNELGLAKNRFYQHKKHPHIAGYNADFGFLLSVPHTLEKVTVGVDITNFSDGKERTLQVEYSLDGMTFSKLAPVTFKGGTTQFKHTFDIQNKSKSLQIRFKRLEKNGKSVSSGFLLLFRNISIDISGTAVAADAVKSEKENSYNLREVFPIGPFWGWERTKAMADYCKMDLWDFVDNQFKLLREHGCNTVWFVNLSGGESLHKLLKIAEKNDIKVLANTSVLSHFYHGISGLESVDNNARNHIINFGNYPALLGYVLKDEPYLQCLENCSYFYQVFKKYDKKRDAVAVVMNRQSPTFIKESKLPVICTDLYYFGSDGSTQIPNGPAVSQSNFSENIRSLNRMSATYGKTHWFMGQIFGSIWGKWHLTPEYKVVAEKGSYLHWRMPTPAECKWQLWEAVRNGSKGLFMYVMHGSAPFFTPFDKAEPNSAAAKRFARQEKRAQQAGKWKGQKLTAERMTFDYNEGWVYPNGKPTPQMTAMGEVFRAVAPLKDFIIKKKFSDFPVFFTRDAKLNITTYEIEGAKRYGIVVNRNTKENRTVTVYLPLNVSSVRDMISGKSYTLKNSGKYFKEISFELSAGGGTVLEADFVSEYVGMPVCHETFDQYSYHRVALTDNGKVATYGEFRIEDNRAVCSKGDADKPVCILKNLSGKKSANNTFSLNINTVKKAANGTLFCMLEGRLLNVTIKAVHDDIASVKSNFLHLREDTVESKKADDKAVKSVTISKNPVNGEAFVIPPGTTALEFYIGDNKSLIDDIYVWFVPNKK